jgi:hypothetical protein
MADTLDSSTPTVDLPDSISGMSADEATALVNGCRDRLALGLVTVFARHLDGANEDFLGMADRATSMEQQQLYFAAMDLINSRGQELLQEFRSAYIKCFDAAVAHLQSRAAPPAMGETDELRLVDTDDFERDLALGKLSARAACNCSQQLTALDRRLAVLLHLPRISQDDNPLYPRTLFGAMLQALNELDVREQLALTLLHEFERQTSVELPGVYADLNRYLVQSGVLPTIPLAGPRTAPRSDPMDGGAVSMGPTTWVGFEPSEDPSLAADPAPTAAEPVAQLQVPTGSERTVSRINDDVFGQLARAIQLATRARPMAVNPVLPGDTYRGAGWSAGVSGGTSGPLGAGPLGAGPASENGGTAHPAPPALDLNQLIQALNSLQRGRMDLTSIPGMRPLKIDLQHADVLHQLRSTPMMVWSRPLDAMTIDIVAMLFDAIFNDPDLSATVRAEVAKLQIPVLKVALVDKSFFSDRKHPARRLLDVVASSGIGRNENDAPRLAAKVREVVDAVLDGFDADVNVFARQTEALEAFLKDEDERARSAAVRVMGQLEQRDRQEIAATRVGDELAPRLAEDATPALIRAFLDRSWRAVLVDVFVQVGDTDPQWQDMVTAMDELIWSVQPKESAEARNRLLTALPDLLRRLRRGLETAHLEASWDPFFDRLIRLHMSALHKETPQNEAHDEDMPLPGMSDAPSSATEDARSHAEESVGLGPPRRAADAPEVADEFLASARSLEVGDWVEFQSFRGTRKTLRLGWVSKYRGVYLFTNRQGENALTLATTSLAAHLRKGTARVLSQDGLTERAVARVFDQVMPEATGEVAVP